MKFDKVFSKGPKILVHCQTVEKEFRAQLFCSDQFCCKGADSSIVEWLEQYSEGKNPTPLLFPLQGSLFQCKILQTLLNIPFGETISYKELALRAGYPTAIRAAASACGRNHALLFIPCHRVIQTNGSLGGFRGGLEIKKRLLHFEAKREAGEESRPSKKIKALFLL